MSGPVVIGWGGEPATGKSLLMAALISTLGPEGQRFQYGTLRGHTYGSKSIAVLGLYESGSMVYPGTDRLSMEVQTDAEQFIETVSYGDPPFRVVLFEGDRLFNMKFIRHCWTTLPESKFFILEASEKVKEMRRSQRDDGKAGPFLKGRATKYANILRYMPRVPLYRNETPDHIEAIVGDVFGWVQEAVRPTVSKGVSP